MGQCPHGTWAWGTTEQCHPSGQYAPPHHMGLEHHRVMPPPSRGTRPPVQGHLPARRRRRVQWAVPWRLLTSQVSSPAAPRPTHGSCRQCWSSSGIIISHVPSSSPSICPPLQADQLSHHSSTGRPTAPLIDPTPQPHDHLLTYSQPQFPPCSPCKVLTPCC